MFLGIAKNVLLKDKLANVEMMKKFIYMIIKMFFIVLYAIFVITGNVKEFWDICVDMNNKLFFLDN